MDFVEGGIAGSEEEGGESPGPTPADAGAANATIEKQAKNDIFGEMGRLTNVVVDHVKLFAGQAGYEPAEDGLEERGGVLRGEGVGGHGEDNGGPEESGPTGAQPRGDQQLLEARFNFWDVPRRQRVYPGVIQHERLVLRES